MRVTYGAGFPAMRSLRDKVDQLHQDLCHVPQVDCPIRHHFAPGMYAREMTIPAGTVVTGAVHKMANLAVLSKGRMLLATETGSIEISAPHTLLVAPGAKNAAVALEDCVWTNFLPNPTDERDLDKLVEVFTESKASDLIGGPGNVQLAANRAAERIEA